MAKSSHSRLLIRYEFNVMSWIHSRSFDSVRLNSAASLLTSICPVFGKNGSINGVILLLFFSWLFWLPWVLGVFAILAVRVLLIFRSGSISTPSSVK